MIAKRTAIKLHQKSAPKIILLFLIFLICKNSKANFIQDSIAIINDSSTTTVAAKYPVDSTSIEDTAHNPFVKLYYQNKLKKTDSLENSTTKNIKKKKEKKIDTKQYSPKKAAIWGAAFPGLGQIYNKRYWKLPIVYGVIGTVLYFVVSNGQKLHTFNGYIRNMYDSIPLPTPYNQLSLSDIETLRNGYRTNLQIASFGTIFAWGLSIVDAVVDAHLHHFDISDKLSIKIKPALNYTNFTYYAGIGVHLNFK